MSHEWDSGIIVANESNSRSWHGLEQSIDNPVDRHDAIRMAGLDWQVGLTEVCYDDGGMMSVVPDQYVVVREDNGAPLGIVGSKYTPIQNEALFDVTEAILGEENSARYNAAASLRGGRTTYVLLKREEQIVPFDEPTEAIAQYLYAATSHDGSMALTAGLTNTRIVCMNTLQMALGGSQTKVAVRHTASADAKMKSAQEILSLSNEYGVRLKQAAEHFMTESMDRDRMRRLLEALFPIRDEESERSVTIANNKRRDVMRNWLLSDNIENVRYTEWGALQAISEWDQHKRNYRGATPEDREDNKFMHALSGNTPLVQAERILASGF